MKKNIIFIFLLIMLLFMSFKNIEESESTQIFTVNGIDFEMVKVDGGTFIMGGTAEQGDYVCDLEKPVHQVIINSYYIGKTEVTQALWKAVMESYISCFAENNLPVEQVNWNDCQEFIKKLNQLTGKKFRLPTEAEWEFAARGGNKSKGYKYAGSNNIEDVAWYTNNSNKQTHPVATKMPNELGIYDMSGNVWEWCYDRDGEYTSDSQINPQGPNVGNSRIYRGGCWYSDATSCRVSFRQSALTLRSSKIGFRLCLSE